MENNLLIAKAVEYAKGNALTSGITASDIATNAGFSIDYFNKIFLSHTGFTVMAYVNYIRLKNATFLLRCTDKSILDIALEIGYDSHEGFIKSFKKNYEMSPSEYRNKNKNQIMYLGELADKSVVERFVHSNPDFKIVDEHLVIDYLLEKDFKRYGYFCTTIKYCGLKIVALNGDFEKGFIGVGDAGNGKHYLEIQTDDFDLLSDWLRRFTERKTFYSNLDEHIVRSHIEKTITDVELSVTPQTLFFGDDINNELPEGVVIRKLCPTDKGFITKWANGKRDSYIEHLLNEQHYLDDTNLEYGVFENDELIAVAGCGIDEVHGLRLNNCCSIRFAEGKENNKLYRSIFTWVTNDIIKNGAIPFDDLQHGDYARNHGNFTSTDVGYRITNYRYDVE